MYRVVESFTDSKDNRHVYLTGDVFPREGVSASDERINELSTTANRRGVVLIKPVGKPKTAAKSKEKPKADKNISKAKKTAKTANKKVK